MPARHLVLAAAAGLAVLGGCGGDGAGRAGDAPPSVSAAASLRTPLSACAKGARLQFGGSDELAAQARRGSPPDLFAAASTELPQRLADEGILEAPVAFATNELVLAAPADGGVEGLGDLGRPGTALAVGGEGVPVGDYTRAFLDRLPEAQRRAVLANVRSEEPDVKGVVAKLQQGAADAGFVYASDVRAAGDALRSIELPEALRPEVVYGAAVRRGAPEAARQLLADLRGGRCRQALRDAGFGPPEGT